ncbi:Peptidase S41 family protein ustP [Lasiodiplodia theobromae]|uniref:Peptidase S41 family protein ustP n=1 Tax=Lasiodiplodia theobromae TaxID=45133 RepID=A0A5N5CVD6_9PEZI|nr:Peptidase S41 family protein ustP [Lasiodiplodia theobromae]
MIDFVVLAAALLSTASLASPTADRNARDTDGCAQMNQWSKANPNKDVPPTLAYGCLKAVPVDVDGDAQLVSEMSNIVRWQSTIAYLKNPPQGYPAPPLDLLGGLNDIKNKISSNGYQSEYDVQMDIVNLFNLAYDGHLGYTPDIATTIGFGRVPEDSNLVSVSSDGKSPPKVYLKTDIDKQHNHGSFIPSAIQSINNQPVSDYLKWLSDTDGSSPDPDTRYQNLFYNPAGASQSQNNGTYFTASGIYEGDSITLTHEDKTTTQLQNVANIQVDLSNINSGSTFFNTFLTGKQSSSSSKPRSSSSKPHPPYGYPAPVWYTSDNTLAGYFLTDANYKDVAVISNPDFQPNDDDEFRNTVSSFLADAVTAKKTHLIIDLRHNSGGSVELGYDLFKQLFPQLEPYGGTRLRGLDTINAMGQVASALTESSASDQKALNTALTLKLPGASHSTSIAEFSYHASLTSAHTDFASWSALFGPDTYAGDTFTRLLRANLSAPALSNLVVSGYGSLTNVPPQPFAASNIVLLLDGACASTCAVFAEMMRTQAGVRSVVVGGRPANTGPAVGVGGTKGAETLHFDQVADKAAAVRALLDNSDADDSTWQRWSGVLGDAGVDGLANSSTVRRRTAKDGGSLNAQINYRNNYRQGDDSGVPLQFVRDYADCRLWYTVPMIYSPVPLWEKVVDAMWLDGDQAGCVAGSTGHAQASEAVGKGYTADAVKTSAAAAPDRGWSGVAAVVACGVAVVMGVL